MPQGDFKDKYLYNYGAGGEIYGGVGWGKTFALATIGYKIYAENSSVVRPTLYVIPIKIGVIQLLLMKRLFVQGDVGTASIKVKGGDSRSAFIYDIGAGVRLAGLELGLFYESFKGSDIYGESIKIIIYNFLRSEIKFVSLEKLKEQLAKDKEDVIKRLSA